MEFYHEPVRYIVIPTLKHSIGKFVIPYVSLNGIGKLNDNYPSFYAVTKKPSTAHYDIGVLTQHTQEAHVVAEDLSLRQGIFTRYAHSLSELQVVNMLDVNTTLRDDYVNDRIAHLGAFLGEAEDPNLHMSGDRRNILVEELGFAVDSLQNFLN